MPALLKTRSSDMGVGAAPIPSVAVAPSPAQNHAIAPGAATSPSASLRCPRCRHSLVPLWEGELRCTRRARPHSYPIVAGIPDLRAKLDADITVARERADARVLAEMLARAPLDGDGLNEDVSLLARGGTLAEESGIGGAYGNSEEVLNDWQDLDRYVSAPRMVLDVGCRTGSLLEAAARRWPVCVGVDGSLRRLVLARHRLNQAGVRARLVCANADALPFADGLFDRVIAEWVLERSPRKERALREWNRTLSEQGRLWISTSNRWSVSRDPELGIPALSWLPMQLVDLWAKWHGLTFPQRALVGTKRLRRLLEETGFSRVRLGKPVADESSGTPSAQLSALTRKVLYDFALVREIAKRVRPMLLATAGVLPRVRSRVAYDRYVARLAL